MEMLLMQVAQRLNGTGGETGHSIANSFWGRQKRTRYWQVIISPREIVN